MPSHLTAAILAKQDDRTSEAVVALLKGNEHFKKLSESEGRDIIQRDNEDDVKLAVGIKYAVDKGVLEQDPHVDPVTKIHVVGKTADEVAAEILEKLPGKTGNVIVLQGLSGTGKGTTVKRLQSALPDCVCWSNGNVFRTFTHLASEHCATNGVEFSRDVLTPSLLQSFVHRLQFKCFSVEKKEFDVVIDDKVRVHDIQNTTLKMPLISQRVPSVAELTQGEVVLFAAKAVETLKSNGCNVILEGRAQTLNYIPSPYRFELVIDEPELLGERRAAQRVMAAAHKAVTSEATDDEVVAAVLKAAEELL